MNESQRVLIIAPFHDPATYLSIKAVNRLIYWIKQENLLRLRNGIEPIKYRCLLGKQANRLSVYFNKRHKFNMVFYFGHGLEDRLGGNWMVILPIIDKYNIGSFKNSIIYTMACYSGNQLAECAINQGVKAYFGMTTQYFGFMSSINHKYLNDWYELVSIIPKSLMKGNTTSQALHTYETKANELYTKYLGLPVSDNIKYLFTNALNMELYGDKMASVPIAQKSFYSNKTI